MKYNLHLDSEYFFFFIEHKFRNYAVKIPNLTVKDNAPFQNSNSQLLFFFRKTIVILLFS